MGLDDVRDLVIVVYGVVGILLFLVMLFVSLLLLFAVRRLTRAVTALVDDPIRPTLEEVRQTVQNVRGATEFAVDTAAHPLIRVVAVTRGARRGLRVLARLRR